MFSAVETVLKHDCMLQGSEEVYKPLLYDSGRAIRFSPDLFILNSSS